MLTLKSHGFKFSRPEANLIFDVSYFVNPWREKEIREETEPEKRKELILFFMNAQPGIPEFVAHTTQLLTSYHNLFPHENIQVAFCCSAGEYRSPALVEMIAGELKKNFIQCNVQQSINSKI